MKVQVGTSSDLEESTEKFKTDDNGYVDIDFRHRLEVSSEFQHLNEKYLKIVTTALFMIKSYRKWFQRRGSKVSQSLS